MLLVASLMMKKKKDKVVVEEMANASNVPSNDPSTLERSERKVRAIFDSQMCFS